MATIKAGIKELNVGNSKMTEIVFPQEEGEPLRVNLKQPFLAAFLAWLWPGAGHWYQGRYAKGALFMTAILGIYLIGSGLGQGRVVYASNDRNDSRWHYFLQLGVGAPALPALLQRSRVAQGKDPLFVLCERYPGDYGGNALRTELDRRRQQLRFHKITAENNFENYQGPTLKDGLMAPPAGPFLEMDQDVLGRWHVELKHFFEIGTYYTVIAGLLNLLVIYDALVGPAIMTPKQQQAMHQNKSKGRRESEENQSGKPD